MDERHDRNIRFFGEEGQQRLREQRVAVVGVGGLGTHVVQELAYLGIGGLALIDHGAHKRTGMNRYVGARHSDPVHGLPKVILGERIAREIDPSIELTPIQRPLAAPESFSAIKAATCVFGCVDKDGPRLVLNELCLAYERPYFDVASEVFGGPPPAYGGRAAAVVDGDACLVCLGQIDLLQAARDLTTPLEREQENELYGVDRTLLGEVGPSVVSVNGVVASLAVTEFVAWATGLRAPNRLLTYRGQLGRVTKGTNSADGCYYCGRVRGRRERAEVERFLPQDTFKVASVG